MKGKTWVIGIGNPLRGDDGAGWAVVEALAAEPLGNVQTLATHQLLPELLETIHDAAQVIFVDAAVLGEPGDVLVTAVQPTQTGPTSSHQIGPGVLLAMGVELYGRMPTATLITITGQSFGYQDGLSATVKNAIAEAICQIEQILQVKDTVS